MPDIRAHGRSSTHPDDATVAAYVDGTLVASERGEIERHLATCDDCYELMSEVVRTEDQFRRHPPQLRTEAVVDPVEQLATQSRGAWSDRRRAMVAAGGVLAVAASVVLLVFNNRSPLAPLVEVVGDQRLTLARPTGGFKYGRLQSPVRGAGPTTRDNFSLLSEARHLEERAARTHAPKDVHAWGIGQLLIGDVDGAVKTLESARNSSPDVAAYEADLGAAYLTLFVQYGRPEDVEMALKSLERATTLDGRLAEAWFNKALLLERMTRTTDAIAAWNRYLEIDGQSEWSTNARRERDALEKASPGR
jgi:tetratricopeptide (TPR) repeat protein